PDARLRSWPCRPRLAADDAHDAALGRVAPIILRALSRLFPSPFLRARDSHLRAFVRRPARVSGRSCTVATTPGDRAPRRTSRRVTPSRDLGVRVWLVGQPFREIVPPVLSHVATPVPHTAAHRTGEGAPRTLLLSSV